MKATEKTFVLGMKKEVNVESFVKWTSLPVGHLLCPSSEKAPGISLMWAQSLLAECGVSWRRNP